MGLSRYNRLGRPFFHLNRYTFSKHHFETDNALDLALALEVSEFFRLSDQRAGEIINEVKLSIRNWRAVATKYGISRTEQDRKAIAFQRAAD